MATRAEYLRLVHEISVSANAVIVAGNELSIIAVDGDSEQVLGVLNRIRIECCRVELAVSERERIREKTRAAGLGI